MKVTELKEKLAQKMSFKKEYHCSNETVETLLHKYRNNPFIIIIEKMEYLGIISKLEFKLLITISPYFLPLDTVEINYKILQKRIEKLKRNSFPQSLNIFRTKAIKELGIQKKRKPYLKQKLTITEIEQNFRSLKLKSKEEKEMLVVGQKVEISEDLLDIWYALAWCYKMIRLQHIRHLEENGFAKVIKPEIFKKKKQK